MTIQTIGVLGAGTMGAGIAITGVLGGYKVVLSDSSAEALSRAETKLDKYLARQVDKGRMDEVSAKTAQARFNLSQDIKGLAPADLVIEAVFEDLTVKREVFAQLEGLVSADCILATNTSALKVGDIAEALSNRARFCGLHYFSPAEINPVVEVIRGAETSEATVAAILPMLAACRKRAIPCKDQSGFALNRFFCPYSNEAVRCLEEGLGTQSQIDAVAMATLGLAIGPFAVMNIVKPSINLAAVRNLSPLGEFYAPAAEFIRVGEAQMLWEIQESPALDANQSAAIADRLRGAIFFAVLDEISEGVAAAADIDMGAQMAFTFAKGPAQMMRELGETEVTRLITLAAGSAATRVENTLQNLLLEPVEA